MITIFSVDLLYFLSWLKSRFENSWFQTSNLNPIKSKNTAFIKKTHQSSILSYQCRILFGISEVALCLLLIVVAFCTSRDVHHLGSWLQILAECSGLEHIYTGNCCCSFALPTFTNPIAVFFPLFIDPINLMVGEDNWGKHAAEEVLEENLPMSQRLRRMRWDQYLLLIAMNFF